MPRHDKETQKRIVALFRDEKVPVSELAVRFRISGRMIRRFIREMEKKNG